MQYNVYIMSFNELRPNVQFQTTAANVSRCISLISVSLLMNRIASAKSLNLPDNNLNASRRWLRLHR